jgi:beta-lactamase superfamily II metal-dependent hydrolase
MLEVHVLNAGKGDSIILRHIADGGEESFALVDSCYFNRADGAPALQRLRELGAKELSFVCLTHPHADHYRGMYSVLEHFENRIDRFFIFPAEEFLNSKIKELAMKYLEIASNQDSEDIKSSNIEFVSILCFIEESIGVENCFPLTGPLSKLAVKGFQGVELFSILPYRAFKGVYLERLRSGDATLFESEQENELSIALKINYAGESVILGADAPKESWLKIRADQKAGRQSEICCKAAKLPHHGSSRDCIDETYEVLFGDDCVESISLISANGTSHPSKVTLANLEKRKILPYCTNFHEVCGNNVVEIKNPADVSPLLIKYINQLSDRRRMIPCQGDIVFSISRTGTLNVETQYKNFCGFRDKIFNYS